MKTQTHIYFVRHAQPDRSVRNDLLCPLTEQGRADARKVTQALKERKITAIYSSPFQRAYDTVKGLALALKLEIQVDEDFRERKVDETWIADFDSFARQQWQDFTYKLAGGECLQEVQQRNIKALLEVLDKHRGERVVIGTHGTALSTILNYFNPAFGYDDFRALVDKMPYILCLRFEGQMFVGAEEVGFE